MKFINFWKYQAGFINTALKNQKTNWVFNLSLWFVPTISLITILFSLWRFPALPPQIPLWYSAAWGTDRLAPSIWLFLTPVMSLIWYGINLLLSIYVTREHYIFPKYYLSPQFFFPYFP